MVAIHGEWDSRIEGGARVKLVAVVPDGVEVEQRAGLSKPLDARGAWGGLSLPSEGWTAVPDPPDARTLPTKQSPPLVDLRKQSSKQSRRLRCVQPERFAFYLFRRVASDTRMLLGYH